MNALRTIEDCLGVLMCVCVRILHTTHAEMQAKCYLFLKAHHICIRVCKEFGIHHCEVHSKCRKSTTFHIFGIVVGQKKLWKITSVTIFWFLSLRSQIICLEGEVNMKVQDIGIMHSSQRTVQNKKNFYQWGIIVCTVT